jgi:hypothetical protein
MTLHYKLLCSEGHETPAEYPSRAMFEKTRDLGWLECATCLSQHKKPEWVRQGLSAPAVNRGASETDKTSPYAYCEDVGHRFYDTMFDMADGLEPVRAIRGRCTKDESDHLLELGAPILPLPEVS